MGGFADQSRMIPTGYFDCWFLNTRDSFSDKGQFVSDGIVDLQFVIRQGTCLIFQAEPATASFDFHFLKIHSLLSGWYSKFHFVTFRQGEDELFLTFQKPVSNIAGRKRVSNFGFLTFGRPAPVSHPVPPCFPFPFPIPVSCSVPCPAQNAPHGPVQQQMCVYMGRRTMGLQAILGRVSGMLK